MQYIEILFFFKNLLFSVATTPLAYLQDVSEGSKMGGMDLGTVIFLLFVAVLMIIFLVCSCRKLFGKVRYKYL